MAYRNKYFQIADTYSAFDRLTDDILRDNPDGAMAKFGKAMSTSNKARVRRIKNKSKKRK